MRKCAESWESTIKCKVYQKLRKYTISWESAESVQKAEKVCLKLRKYTNS